MAPPALCPRLKPRLKFSLQTFCGETVCILEDPLTGQFWRLGLREFKLLQMMNGATPADQLLQKMAGMDAENSLRTEDVEYIIAWIAREGLLCDISSAAPTPAAPWYQRMGSTVFYRLRLGNPQPVLRRLYPWLGILTGWAFFPIWLGALVVAAVLLVGNWSAFQSDAMQVISPDQWLTFVLIWWSLKAIHEMFHGLTCLRYGGNVPDAGILFILFAPLGAYVDVTSTWRLSSKWKRMHVTAAGIYAELFMASIACIVWSTTESLLVRQIALQTMLLASVATIFFNANPLIRFDGYYLLADWLELPNLYQRGQLALRRLVGRIFLGPSSVRVRVETQHRATFLLYGMASLIWRIVLCLSIMFTAAQLMDGAGLMLSWLLVFAWFAYPTLAAAGRLALLAWKQPLRILRCAAVTSILGFSLFAISKWVSIPHYLIAPGVVRPLNSTALYSPEAGEVTEILVEPGQVVQQDTELLVLRNAELALEALRLEQEIQRVETRRSQLLAKREIGQELAETAVLDELKQQLQSIKERDQRMRVRAPHSGVVMDFDKGALLGSWVRRGQSLIEVSDLSTLEFAFSAPQEQLRQFDGIEVAHQALVYLPGSPAIHPNQSTLRWLPTADWELESSSLAASSGGSVAMTQMQDSDGEIISRTLHPRIHGRVLLPADCRVHAGVTGNVRLAGESRRLWEVSGDWIQRIWHQAVEKLQWNSANRDMAGS